MKKLTNKRILKNNHGSIMSTALVVIAILTFSLTSITVLTVNLAKNTTNLLNLTTEENEAKALISNAVNQFEIFIRDNDSVDDLDDLIIDIKNELNVDVLDITASKPNFGTATSGAETYAYKFSVTISTGRIIYLEVYISTYGSTADTFEPFEFSLATSGDLVLNGGMYNDAKIYGNRIMISDLPYFYDEIYVSWRSLDGDYPLFTFDSSFTEIFSTDYNYCNTNCWQVTDTYDPDADIIMVDSTPSIYNDVWESTDPYNPTDKGYEGDMIIADFFTSFDFDTFFFTYVKEGAPTNSRILPVDVDWGNIIDVIETYTDNYYFDDVTGANYNRNRRFRDSSVFNDNGNPLVITQNITISNDSDALIVVGDLIFNTNDNLTQVDGNFIVLGDLIINGDSLDMEGSFFVQGEIIVNMNDDEGILTNGSNYGLTLLAKDNIRFERMFVNETLSSYENLSEISAFIFTEQSIEIDAIHSIFEFSGAIFAQAVGGSSNPIQLIDESHTQIDGIVINSYTGYLYPYYTWWGGYYYAVPSGDEDNTRFQMNSIEQNNYILTFINIPEFESVFSSDGQWTFKVSEFGYEN